jgi:hypothetical protein
MAHWCRPSIGDELRGICSLSDDRFDIRGDSDSAAGDAPASRFEVLGENGDACDWLAHTGYRELGRVLLESADLISAKGWT